MNARKKLALVQFEFMSYVNRKQAAIVPRLIIPKVIQGELKTVVLQKARLTLFAACVRR